MSKLSILMTLACMLFITGSAIAQSYTHPMHGNPPSVTFDNEYGPGHGLSSSLSYGDLTFTDDLPSASSLTDEEKYIIAGSESSSLPGGTGLQPWSSVIFSALNLYYGAYGSLPEVLTPEAIRCIPGYTDAPDNYISEYLNPLTDQWPRLDATNESPGDLYVRVLTDQEIAYFAEHAPSYHDMFIDGYSYDAASQRVRPVEVSSPVFYMRIYGWHGVLANALIFVWHWTDE